MAEIPRREKATVLFVATVGSLIFEKDSQLLVRNSFRGKPWKKPMPRGIERCFFPLFLSFFLPSVLFSNPRKKKTVRVFSNSRRPKSGSIWSVLIRRDRPGPNRSVRLELMRQIFVSRKISAPHRFGFASTRVRRVRGSISEKERK